MNDELCEQVRAELKRRSLTHAQVAEALGMPRPQLTRMLTGRSGPIPAGWQKLLHALNLKITLAPNEPQED